MPVDSNQPSLNHRPRQRELWAVILPLAAVPVMMNLSRTFFSAVLNRFESATDELAAFGVGFYLVMMLWSPSMHFDQMTLMFGKTRRSFRRVLAAATLFGCAVSALGLAIGLVPPLRWFVIEFLQRSPDAAVSDRVAFVVMALAPVPLIQALERVIRGALIQARRTRLVFIVFATGRVLSIAGAIALFPADFIQERPLLLPVIAYFIDSATRLVAYAFIAWRVVWPQLPENGDEPPALSTLFRFQYPLMLTALMMALSRPIINAFIAGLDDGKIGLAALTVVYPLSNLTYGWLNDARVLAPAFRDRPDSIRAIRRFSLTSSSIVFVVTALLFATPTVDVILSRVMGAADDLLPYCRSALLVFCLFPFVVAARGYIQGVAVAQGRTMSMLWSGPLRVVSIVVALYSLAFAGVGGATLGAIALLVGFITEATVVVISLARPR